MKIFGWDISKRLSVLMNPTPGSDHSAMGTIVAYVTCGETLAVSTCIYIKADGKAWKADKDAASTMPGVALMLQSGVADESRKALFMGFMRDDTWNWTLGGEDGIIYVGDSGALTQDLSGYTTGDQVQTMGVATHADRMLVYPNHVLVEVP